MNREVHVFIDMWLIDNEIESVRVVDDINLVKMIQEEGDYTHHFVREIEPTDNSGGDF